MTTEQGRVLVARLRQRCDNLGGCDDWGADHEDGERALPYIERETAQQERERLRKKPILGDADGMSPYPLPEWVKTPTRKGEAPIDLLEHFRTWLLADPEDDR